MPISNVRRFLLSDVPDLLIMAEQFCRDKGIELNADSMYEYIKSIDEKGVAFVYEKNFKVIGAMGIVESKNPFTGEKVLMQCDLFVHEDYRHQGIAKALKDHATQFAKAIGIENTTWA